MQETISQAEIQDSQLALQTVIEYNPVPMGENNVLVAKVTWDDITYYLELLRMFLEQVKPIFKDGKIKKWQFWKWGKLVVLVVKLILSIKQK